MKKLFLAAGCFILLTQFILAQDVRVYTSSPFISLNDKLQVILVLQGRHSNINPKFPNIRGFTKVSDDAIVNMRSQGKETNFLQAYKPTTTGTFTVPSFPVKVGNKMHKTRSLIVKVDAARPRSSSYSKTSSDISLKIHCDRDYVYPGEPVKTEIQLWIKETDRKKIRFDSLGIRGMTDNIHWAGFREMRQIAQKPQIERVKLNGNHYQKHTLYRTYLIPTDTGKFEFKNISLNYDHLYVEDNPSNGRRKAQYRIEFLEAADKVISVKPLPKTRLAKARTIGDFNLNYHLAKNQYSTGESIALLLEVEGKGNFHMAPRPELPDYIDLLSFDPVTYMKRDSGEAYSGLKSFNYELIAAKAGKYDLGPIVFYFFDPEKEAYDSTFIKSIPINVSGDDIPQLLEVNALDKFYRRAFKSAEEKPPLGFAYASWLIVGFTVFSLLMIVWRMSREEQTSVPSRKKKKLPWD